MAGKMVRTQIYLEADMYEWLKRRAKRENRPMAEQIREAVAQYKVAENQSEAEALPVLSADDPIWELIGSGESGITDGSVNHDKYIYRRDWDEDDK